jgi:predicted HicB family RNase H-like nuclease
MRERIQKIAIAFRIDPVIKEAARKCALEAKQTLSRYIEQLIKLDLWRKRLLG